MEIHTHMINAKSDVREVMRTKPIFCLLSVLLFLSSGCEDRPVAEETPAEKKVELVTHPLEDGLTFYVVDTPALDFSCIPCVHSVRDSIRQRVTGAKSFKFYENDGSVAFTSLSTPDEVERALAEAIPQNEYLKNAKLRK